MNARGVVDRQTAQIIERNRNALLAGIPNRAEKIKLLFKEGTALSTACPSGRYVMERSNLAPACHALISPLKASKILTSSFG